MDRPLARRYIHCHMSDLDDELRKAVLESEQEAQTSEGAVPEAPAVSLSGGSGADEPESSRNWGLLAALLVAAAGILTLVLTSVDGAAIYSVSTAQLLDEVEKYDGKNVRVEGELVQGTLRHRAEPCEYRFFMQTDGKKLEVRFPNCVIPDTLKDVPEIPVKVVAEGSLSAQGFFLATQLLAKCPSKYEMEERAKKGETAPHAMAPPPIEE